MRGARLDDADWLTQGPAARVLALLNRDGEEARIVGGAVRNALMGLAHGDIDIATTALPDRVMARAQAAGIHAVPTGIAHGTVTLVLDGQPFEVTTLREDVETFGRHATVKFGRDWARDAARRDFTMNALSAASDGTVYDYCGGLGDIAERRVRFIGDASARIAEDYLRILRFFRMHAAYGQGCPDADALHAAIAGRHGLAQLSAERVRMELVKLVVAPGAGEAVAAMADAGLLMMVLGGVAYLPAFDGMVMAEAVQGLAPDAMRRLAALGVAVPEDAERLSLRLKLSKAEGRRLAAMTERWWRVRELTEPAARALLYRLGAEAYRDRVMLAWARAGRRANALGWLDVATLAMRWQAPVFPLRAADFLARGFHQGPALGAVLAQAEAAWIDAGFPLEPARVGALADEAAATFRHDHRF